MPKVALIQKSCTSDIEENTKTALSAVRRAAERGAEIVCLPELFRHLYFPVEAAKRKVFAAAETIPGETTSRLSALAKELKIYLIGGSLFERAGEGSTAKYYNSAVVFDSEGKLITVYRKCHIPQDPGFFEKDYFAPGNGFEIIDTKFGKICVMICFDQWFPEAARNAALAGAQLIFYPTAIGMPENVENITGDWLLMWQTAQRGHAAANNVYVAAANRVGREEADDGSATVFFGGSFVADYSGALAAEAGNGEEIVIADCDFARQRDVQQAWCFFTNRRPELYGALTKTPRAEPK